MGYNHVDMTPTSSMLAVFASKNKQVAQIQIQVSHLEAVSTRVELDRQLHKQGCCSKLLYGPCMIVPHKWTKICWLATAN